jgi:hypothetical protein
MALARVVRSPREQHSAVSLENALHAGDRVPPVPLATRRAREMVVSRVEFSAATGTEPPVVECTHEEDMMENPDPTETEHQLAGTERHEEEEDMRGITNPDDEDNLPSEDE